MNHVVIGAALPFAICVLLYARAGGRASGRLLVLGPIAMLASGTLAVFPDLPRALHDTDRYFAWHQAAWCNVSWGHCWIDAHPESEDWLGWTVLGVLLGAAVLGAAYRELRRREATWRT